MAEFGCLPGDSGGTFRVSVDEITSGEESVVVPARATATRGDKTLDSAYSHVFHFSGELVSEAWVVNHDQAPSSAFWQSEIHSASKPGCGAEGFGCRV
jgi:hypothetical protein